MAKHKVQAHNTSASVIIVDDESTQRSRKRLKSIFKKKRKNSTKSNSAVFTKQRRKSTRIEKKQNVGQMDSFRRTKRISTKFSILPDTNIVRSLRRKPKQLHSHKCQLQYNNDIIIIDDDDYDHDNPRGNKLVSNIRPTGKEALKEMRINSSNDASRLMANHLDNSVIIVDENGHPIKKRRKKKNKKRRNKKKKSNGAISNFIISTEPRRKSIRIETKNRMAVLNTFQTNNQINLISNKSLPLNKIIRRSPRKTPRKLQSQKCLSDHDVIVIPDDTIIIDDDDCMESNKLFSNIYNVQPTKREGLREIVIDGNSVAMGYSRNGSFSVEGLKQVIDYFLQKGHKVKAFVPQYRLKLRNSTNQRLLESLVKKSYVIITPSRLVNGNLIVSHDGRYIIQYATHCEGVVVSNNDFKDIVHENTEWTKTVETRLIAPMWSNNQIFFKKQPIGQRGPSLTTLLKFP